MKFVVVTGANGFVGSHLIRELVKHDISVIAFDRDCSTDNLPKSNLIEFVPCDLQDIASIDTLHIRQSPDAFYHLAWQGVSPDYRNNFDMQIANLGYSLDCVRLAKRMNAKKFVLPGSTLEYVYNDSPINQNSLPTPQNAYGSVKIATRFLCGQLAVQMQLPFVYTVMTSIYGPGREDNNVISYTIRQLLRGEMPQLSRLEQRWDFLHIRDAAEALVAIGEHGKAGAFYAVGAGENNVLSDYIFMIRDMINPKIPLGIGAVPYQNSRLPNSMIDNSCLAADTQFVPNISFKEGIAQVIAYYQSKIKEDKNHV